MVKIINNIELTEDDTLKNILIMAPMLDEVGQNRVFGLMCGLLSGSNENEGDSKEKEYRRGYKESEVIHNESHYRSKRNAVHAKSGTCSAVRNQ